MRSTLLVLLAAAACSFEPEPVEEPTPVPGGELPADDGERPIEDDGDGDGDGTPSDPDGPCVPLTCADMGAQCGPMDDGCGVQLDCGGCEGSCEDSRCVCLADSMEPNPSAEGAHDLGEFWDELGADETVDELVVRDESDEDWFRFRVLDIPGIMNPAIVVELEQEGQVHQLDVFYTCDHGDDETTCVGSAQEADGFGTACRGVGEDPAAGLAAECGGTLDESGTVWVRVRRSSWDASCQAYSVRVLVNDL